MDFSHNQQFTAKKASGIGVVVLLHVLLAGGLIYGLKTTTVPHDHSFPITPLDPPKFKPEPPKPNIDPMPKKIDFNFQPIDRPVIDPVDPPFAHVDPHLPVDPLPKNGPGIEKGPVDGGGTKPAVHTSSPIISNLNECKPTYPASAIKLDEEGTVQLKLDVGANGQLLGAAVMKSSGYADLDRAALKGLSQCDFKAATQDGTPVRSSFLTEYVWSLDR